MACGEAHTLVLSEKDGFYSFGWSEDGQLGAPSNVIGSSIQQDIFHVAIPQ